MIRVIGLFLLLIISKWPFSSANSDNISTCTNRLPQAIIIGVKKSGTFALLKYLSINPKIKVAIRNQSANSSLHGKMNEIHFFDREDNWSKGLDWYKSQMPLVCDKLSSVVIEKTPGYFRSSVAPKRVYEYNSSVKIILIVREPFKRLRSELTHCDMRQKSMNKPRKCSQANEELTRALREALYSPTKQRYLNESVLLANKFIRNSIYYLDILDWIKYFKIGEQMLVVDGERFIREPWHELNRVERFLGLNESISREDFYFDRRKRFFCVRDEKLIETTNDMSNRLGKCLGKNKGRHTHIVLSDFVRDGLKKFFKNWNQRFFDLIGNEFDWS